MRKRNPSVQSVITCFLKKVLLNLHIDSVHEKKKPQKCSIFDYSCSQKGGLNFHIDSVHEKKKQKYSLCDSRFSKKKPQKYSIWDYS